MNLFSLNLLLADLELCLTAFAAHRIRRFQAPAKLIEEIDSAPAPPPPCPRGKIRLHVRPSNPQQQVGASPLNRGISSVRPPAVAGGGESRLSVPQAISTAGGVASPQQPRLAAPAPSLLPSIAVAAATRPQLQLQFVQQSGTLHAVAVAPGATAPANSSRGFSVQLAQVGEARLAFPSSVAQQIVNAASAVNTNSNSNQQDSNATVPGC